MLAVATYHYIRESFEQKYPAIFGITPKAFEHQLELLAKQGKFISRNEIVTCVEQQKELKGKNILVTFDDGLKEQYAYAKPILERNGIPYVFFINPCNVAEGRVSLVHQIHLLRSMLGSKGLLDELAHIDTGAEKITVNLTDEERKKAEFHYNYDAADDAHLKYFLNLKLNWLTASLIIKRVFKKLFNEQRICEELYMNRAEVQRLCDQQTLGSHTFEHKALNQLSFSEKMEEIRNAQDAFRTLVGSPLKAISYPYGDRGSCAKDIRKIALEAGHVIGFSMERALNDNRLYHEPLALARYDCNDLPGGKNNLFSTRSLFARTIPRREWHTI